MARTRGIRTGADTLVGRLAERFRQGLFGGAAPGERIEPGRGVLHSVKEIIRAAVEAGIALFGGRPNTESIRYVCIYTDPRTGAEIARVAVTEEYPIGTARSTVFSRARKDAQKILDSDYGYRYLLVEAESIEGIVPNVSCKVVRGSKFQYRSRRGT